MTSASPASGTGEPIEFAAAAEIIAHLPLHRPAEAEARLGDLLAAVLAHPPQPQQLFSLLEYARPSLHFVRATAVKHYHEHAPHLADDAEAHFQRGLQLWRQVVEAYQHCADAFATDTAKSATLLHRCLLYIGMQIMEHYRVKRQVPDRLWQELNHAYAFAEARSLARIALSEDLPDESRTPHIQALYIAHLLTEVAQPYGRNAADLNLIWQWADRWAHLARLGRPRIAANKIAFVVDLKASRPLHPRAGGELPESIRGLNTSALIQQLRDHLNDISTPDASERLHLSPDGIARQQHLLQKLIATWSLDSLPRRFRRTPADELIALTSSLHGIYDVLSGQGTAEGKPDALTEAWRVIDHTPSGFRLSREAEGLRIENGQLVALRPHDGGDYLLTQVQWLMREQSGALLAGFAVLPGIPRPVSILADERFKGQVARTVRAFLLPAVTAMQSEAAIVLPAGFYQAGKVIELEEGKLRLLELIQRGSDFERATYVRL